MELNQKERQGEHMTFETKPGVRNGASEPQRVVVVSFAPTVYDIIRIAMIVALVQAGVLFAVIIIAVAFGFVPR